MVATPNVVLLRHEAVGVLIVVASKQEQMRFLADTIRKVQSYTYSFHNRSMLQMHGLDGETILQLFEECYEHGIYNRECRRR